MINLRDGAAVPIRHIFHPTDFSHASMAAFGHALKLSLAMKSDLTIMHVDPARADLDFDDFPRVRATLARWGILKDGATREDFFALGLGVRKIRAMDQHPIASIQQLLWRKPADLMVLATHPKDTLRQWLSDSPGETLARKSRTASLFVPNDGEGFISLRNGAVSLRRILIPIDHQPDPQPAIDTACALAGKLAVEAATFEVLYVGTAEKMPRLRLPHRDGWIWKHSLSTGIVVDEILDAAARRQPDLIVMATEGRHGFLDALRGSTTERVLRETRCPLLAVPVREALVS